MWRPLPRFWRSMVLLACGELTERYFVLPKSFRSSSCFVSRPVWTPSVSVRRYKFDKDSPTASRTGEVLLQSDDCMVQEGISRVIAVLGSIKSIPLCWRQSDSAFDKRLHELKNFKKDEVCARSPSYLTQCINSMVFEVKLLH